LVSEEAKKISKEFLRLQSFGAIIRNYNSKRGLANAQSGWVDHVIIYKNKMYLIEIKIGKDKLNPKQLELAKKLLKFNTEIHYLIISSIEEAKEFVEIILDERTTEDELWRFEGRTRRIVELEND